MTKKHEEFLAQLPVYLLRRELLAVYSHDLGKGCMLVPSGAFITVLREEESFFCFSWDHRTLRAFAEDIQHRGEIMPSTLVRYATSG